MNGMEATPGIKKPWSKKERVREWDREGERDREREAGVYLNNQTQWELEWNYSGKLNPAAVRCEARGRDGGGGSV